MNPVNKPELCSADERVALCYSRVDQYLADWRGVAWRGVAWRGVGLAIGEPIRSDRTQNKAGARRALFARDRPRPTAAAQPQTVKRRRFD